MQIAKNAGFDGIELLISRANCDLKIQHIRELSDKYDVPVLSFHSPFMICNGWGGFWNRIRLSLIMTMKLGIPLMNFHPPVGHIPRHRLNDELSEYVEFYKGMIKDSDIILTIENLPTRRSLGTMLINRYFPLFINNMYQIADFAAKSDIHVTFDTTHVGTTGVNLLQAYSVFKDRIANIHLSDHYGRSQHLLPGTGNLPLKQLLNKVADDGYNGIVTLETCPEAMEYKDRSKAAQNAEAALKYIKDALQNNGV